MSRYSWRAEQVTQYDGQSINTRVDVPAAVWCACWCLWFLGCFCNNLWLNLEITGILHSCPDVGLTYNTKCLFELQTLSDAKSKSSSVAWPKCNRRTLKSWSDCWAFCWCYKKRPHCCLLDMTRSFVSSNYAPGTTSGMFVMGLKRHQYSRRCNVLFLTTLRVSYWNCLVWFYLQGEHLSPVTSKTLGGPFVGRMFNKLKFPVCSSCVHEQRKRDHRYASWWQQVRNSLHRTPVDRGVRTSVRRKEELFVMIGWS